MESRRRTLPETLTTVVTWLCARLKSKKNIGDESIEEQKKKNRDSTGRSKEEGLMLIR